MFNYTDLFIGNFLIAAKYYQPKSIVAYNTENLLTKTNKVELHSPVQAY